MILSLIAACGKNGELGLDNQLLWKISDDLKNFKRLTQGKHLLMGRKTYESIGYPLPGRETIILSRNPTFDRPCCGLVHSIEEGIAFAKEREVKELVICGGGEVYKQALPLVERIYLSRIDGEAEADTFFPSLNPDEWQVKEKQVYPAQPGLPGWSFEWLERV